MSRNQNLLLINSPRFNESEGRSSNGNRKDAFQTIIQILFVIKFHSRQKKSAENLCNIFSTWYEIRDNFLPDEEEIK